MRLFCSLGLLVCSAACAAPTQRSASDAPATLSVSGLVVPAGQPTCIGTLVASDAVVTSKQCAQDVWEQRYTFLPGSSPHADAYAHLVRSVIFHPQTDVAVLILEDPMPGAPLAAVDVSADANNVLRNATVLDYVTLPASGEPPLLQVTASRRAWDGNGIHVSPPNPSYAVRGGGVFARPRGDAPLQLVGVVSGPRPDGMTAARVDGLWLQRSLAAACRSGERRLCSPPAGNTAQAIIEGVPADSRFASAAALMIGTTQSCSAVLVEPDLALTAAHCVEDVAASHRLELRFGSSSQRRAWRSTSLVRHVVTHPQFSTDTCSAAANAGDANVLAACQEIADACPDSRPEARDTCVVQLPAELLYRAGIFGVGAAHDAALLFLAHPTEAATPVPLLPPNSWLIPDLLLSSVGYGQRSGDHQDPNAPHGERYLATNSIAALNDTELQLGTEPPQGCWGDSGGPAFTNHNATWYVAGIASRLTASFSCDSGQTFTRVDAVSGWVEEAKRQACVDEQLFSCRLPAHEQPGCRGT